MSEVLAERVVSLPTKIRQIAGLVGLRTTTAREDHFIRGVVELTKEGRFAGRLSKKQREWVEVIWAEEFA